MAGLLVSLLSANAPQSNHTKTDKVQSAAAVTTRNTNQWRSLMGMRVGWWTVRGVPEPLTIVAESKSDYRNTYIYSITVSFWATPGPSFKHPPEILWGHRRAPHTCTHACTHARGCTRLQAWALRKTSRKAAGFPKHTLTSLTISN